MRINPYIDAALLTAVATSAQVKKLCKEAKLHKFFAVDVLPLFFTLAEKEINGCGVKVVAVVGYPLGQNTTADKTFETKEAIKNGAGEIDMVMNIGMFKAQEFNVVQQDISAVVAAAKGRIVKVIIETGLLSDKEIIAASKLVRKAGAHFVKTCSGYGPRGATLKDIKLIRKAVGKFGIKASGGIRTARQAFEFVKAGATRIGTSHGVQMVHRFKSNVSKPK